MRRGFVAAASSRDFRGEAGTSHFLERFEELFDLRFADEFRNCHPDPAKRATDLFLQWKFCGSSVEVQRSSNAA